MSLSHPTKVKDLFLDCCQSNIINKVRYFLSQGANVNWKRDSDLQESGLHIAAGRNYGELLELLLGLPGVDVNITDGGNVTPLMWACSAGHENIVRRLSRVEGIKPNSRDNIGRTALHWAVNQNNPRCVEALRTVAGVDWNITTDAGYNPLKWAVERGYADILQTLLSVSDLDLSVTDGRGRTVAQIAVEEERGERQRCVEILSRDRRVDWNMKNSFGDTPVMFCLKNNKIEKARCLINTPGVDLDTVDRDGKKLETIAR